MAIIFLSHQNVAPLYITLFARFFCATAAGYRPSVNKEKDIVCPLLNREVEREYYTGGDAY